MTNIEKIRQEIERRKVQYYEREMKAWDDNGEYGDEDCYFYQGQRKACEGLLLFLDTLSEEPDNEDLNDEIKKFIEEYGYERGEDKLLIAIVARHFANWQKQQMLKDAVEGMVCATITGTNAISFLSPLPDELNAGDKIRIVVLKAEEE